MITVFGGVCKTAKAIGKQPTVVSAWKRAGGRIPRDAQEKILTIALERGLDISGNDLILGRKQNG